MRIFLLVASFCFIITSCSSSKKVVENKQVDLLECQEMILLKEPLESLSFDHYYIDSVMINNQCLDFVVNYGGGCGEARFELYYGNELMESMPPKTVIYLSFEDIDPCRSIVTKKLSFNLSPFKKYADRGGIYFKIHGSDKSILYQIPK